MIVMTTDERSIIALLIGITIVPILYVYNLVLELIKDNKSNDK